MKSAAIAKVIPSIALAACVFLLVFWYSSNRRVATPVKRVPGQDRQVEAAAGQTEMPVGAPAGPPFAPPGSGAVAPAAQTGQTIASGAAAPPVPGEWPRFRGPNFDNISTETVPLAARWPAGAPPLLWAMDVGEGYAAAAVSNSRVYILDYDRQAQADVLKCLALADGKELWRYAYPVSVKRNHGMSRTVPAVSGKYVVTLGPKCHVLCADALTGQVHWVIDLTRDYRTEVPQWYAGQCPLIDGDRAIIAPAGSALMVAIDCATGRVIWKTPNPNNWAMTHSSIVPMTFSGQRMYVYCASGGVVGVSARDGSILWQFADWTVKIANIPSPVVIGEDRIFLSGGYDSGSMMLHLRAEGGRISARQLFRLKPSVFGSDQQTPIYYKGYIYGVIPGGRMACLDLNGRQKWVSPSTYTFGLGPYMIADGKILAMNDSGVLTVAEATPAGFRPLAQARLLGGHDSWGPMALAGGRLIARDLTRMVCVMLAKS